MRLAYQVFRITRRAFCCSSTLSVITSAKHRSRHRSAKCGHRQLGKITTFEISYHCPFPSVIPLLLSNQLKADSICLLHTKIHRVIGVKRNCNSTFAMIPRSLQARTKESPLIALNLEVSTLIPGLCSRDTKPFDFSNLWHSEPRYDFRSAIGGSGQ